MARLLARCVNSGIKVLITTHSDYIIKEFNNLIMLGNDFSSKENFIKRHTKNYRGDDYLKKESVCAYICEKNSITPCEVNKFGINMPNFDVTIDEINGIASELFLLLDSNEII